MRLHKSKSVRWVDLVGVSKSELLDSVDSVLGTYGLRRWFATWETLTLTILVGFVWHRHSIIAHYWITLVRL